MTTGGTLPTRMTLKPSKLKWAVTLLICLVFVAAAVFLTPPEEDQTMRWLAIGFFGIGIFASLPGLFGVGGLELDQEGFTILHWGKSTRRTWRECSEFSILRMRGGPFVGFSSETDASKAAAGLARSLVGETGMLPDRYGMSAKALAELMNRFRARALGRAV
jgi:hypothetical protein